MISGSVGVAGTFKIGQCCSETITFFARPIAEAVWKEAGTAALRQRGTEAFACIEGSPVKPLFDMALVQLYV
jgi:xanthine/CO dehydrogenase XdhC/CoxF family maturation factor